LSDKKTVSFKTFGCKLNQYDTDFLIQSFEDAGYETRVAGPSDIVVINTCAVTSRSAAKCRQAIRAAARSGAKVLVTGCYAQVAYEEIASIPGVIGVTGVVNRSGLVDVAERALSDGAKVVDVKPHGEEAVFEETPVRKPSLTRAFLKIQEGCNDYCTYCIVPYARGPSRSRPLEDILLEARELVERGYKEIILTGTHLGLYGKDFARDICGHSDACAGHGFSLADVIHSLTQIDGLLRLRISSLEPHDVTPDLIDCFRYPEVCHHIHLPLQSGSDRILKSMGRRYDVATFLEIVKDVRKVAPDIGMAADIIVGFPGEKDSDFEDTLNVMRTAGFSRVHVFQYSPRPGTPASRFSAKVPEREKEKRSKEAISLGRKLSLEFHERLLGRRIEVLVEEDKTRDGLLQGVTRNYVKVWFEGPEELQGQIIEVLPQEARYDGLIATCSNRAVCGCDYSN